MTGINELDRYQRQALIEGWDQTKLSGATVTILGSDKLAQYIAIPLTALGVNVRMVDNASAHEDMMLDITLKGESKAASIENVLKKLNPQATPFGIHASLENEGSKYFLEGSSVIIDATNNPRSKYIALEYGRETKTPVITAGCKEGFGRIMLYNGDEDVAYVMPDLAKDDQDTLVSMVLGGVVCDEVKKLLMTPEQALDRPLYYSPLHPDRFTFEKGKDLERKIGEYMGKKALVVGAGALGNFLGTGIIKLGFGQIDIVDMDTVEATNLNRQILFYDAVGKRKAEALAEKLAKMSYGLVKVRSLHGKFGEDFDAGVKYDVVFDCVDNFFTRAMISNYAVERKIPLISGATSFEAGQVAIYVPGQTACMDCQLDIVKRGIEAEEIRRQTCLAAPNPSVIMTNQVIGSMMANEARTIIDPTRYGPPINGVLKYTTNLESRWGLNKLKEPCTCTAKPLKIAVPDTREEKKEPLEIKIAKGK